jgi:perosamine synthetase
MDENSMIKLAHPAVSEDAIQKVVEVLCSGALVQGEYVRQFEEDLQSYLDVKYAVVVSSGTAALHLSLLALGIKSGDEVIVPGYTFPATANVVELVGATPIFVDINLTDYCIDVSQVEQAITGKTKAIMPVHEFGQAAQMDEILRLAKKHNLSIVEDAACALGAKYKDRFVGSLGDCGCFSFHPRKMVTTGEGGVVVTNNTETFTKIQALRNHGIDLSRQKFDIVYPGYNYRMTEFQAVCGLDQLSQHESGIEKRLKQVDFYDQRLSSINWITTPAVFADRRMVYQTYHVLLLDGINRDNFITYMRDKSVETNYGAQALASMSYYKNKYRLDPMDFPNSKNSFEQGLALPLGLHITNEELKYVVESINSFI